jgi:hypothetical protein
MRVEERWAELISPAEFEALRGGLLGLLAALRDQPAGDQPPGELPAGEQPAGD